MLQAIQAALAVIEAGAALLPNLIKLLDAIEAAMPTSPADAKIEMAKTVLQASVKDVDITTQDVWPVVLAVFEQRATAPAAPAPVAA